VSGRNGFTLIEILIATMILSFGLLTLMVGLGNCAAMMSLAKEYQDAQYVFSLGELKYPIMDSTDVEEELPVDPDSELIEGYVFERTVDEKELEQNEVDDNLYVVRTRVSWGTGENQYEELVRYVRQLKAESDKKK
jgi:prepilin-type N-terminal cleavage/methylation domain-containing protein